MRFAALAALVALCACGSHAPPLVAPERIDSFCGHGKAAPGDAFVAILSSVADRPVDVPVPADADLRSQLALDGGAIGHWTAQPLYMPGTASALGVSGSYVDITDVAIDDRLDDPDARVIFVTATGAKGPQRLALRAYELESVCTGVEPPQAQST